MAESIKPADNAANTQNPNKATSDTNPQMTRIKAIATNSSIPISKKALKNNVLIYGSPLSF